MAVLLCAAGVRADAPGWLERENGDVEEGNARMAAGDAKGALAAYDTAARELPSHGGVHLNRGLALMAQGDRAAAREALKLGTRPPGDRSMRADAHYDLGLTFYREGEELAGQEEHDTAQQRFREAVDGFKDALRLRPGDRNTAWNLELAMRRLLEEKQKQEQKEQQEKEQQEQEQQDQEPQDGGEQGDKQPGDQDQQEPQDDQQKPSPDEPQKPQEPQQPDAEPQKPEPKPEDQKQPQPSQEPQPQEPQAVPADVGRALDALQDGEQNLEKLKARQRASQQQRRVEKDW